MSVKVCCHCGEEFEEFSDKICTDPDWIYCEEHPNDEPRIDDWAEQPLNWGVN